MRVRLEPVDDPRDQRRLGPYDRDRLHELIYRRRELTEQWAHEASVVPMDAWPLLALSGIVLLLCLRYLAGRLARPDR